LKFHCNNCNTKARSILSLYVNRLSCLVIDMNRVGYEFETLELQDKRLTETCSETSSRWSKGFIRGRQNELKPTDDLSLPNSRPKLGSFSVIVFIGMTGKMPSAVYAFTLFNVIFCFLFYQFILICLLHSSRCFEHYCAHLREDNCINTASGIVTLFGWLFSTQVTRGLS